MEHVSCQLYFIVFGSYREFFQLRMRKASRGFQAERSTESREARDEGGDGDGVTSAVRLLRIPRAAPGLDQYGFHLTRSKWDPYPWVTK